MVARHRNWLARLDAVREVLASGGRTLAQGALGWLLARSPRTVPIPGIRTVAQAEQNAGALRLGPLPTSGDGGDHPAARPAPLAGGSSPHRVLDPPAAAWISLVSADHNGRTPDRRH